MPNTLDICVCVMRIRKPETAAAGSAIVADNNQVDITKLEECALRQSSMQQPRQRRREKVAGLPPADAVHGCLQERLAKLEFSGMTGLWQADSSKLPETGARFPQPCNVNIMSSKHVSGNVQLCHLLPTHQPKGIALHTAGTVSEERTTWPLPPKQP